MGAAVVPVVQLGDKRVVAVPVERAAKQEHGGGATNVTCVWCPNVVSVETTTWQRLHGSVSMDLRDLWPDDRSRLSGSSAFSCASIG